MVMNTQLVRMVHMMSTLNKVEEYCQGRQNSVENLSFMPHHAFYTMKFKPFMPLLFYYSVHLFHFCNSTTTY